MSGTSPFYPYHAARDLAVILVVAVALVALAWRGVPPLEAPADPTDAAYTPRPEWYFLGLFQLLKYFPGRLEVIGAIVVPGLAVLALALLPWVDRGPAREPRRRRGSLGAVALAVVAVVALTAAGWRDRPAPTGGRWTPREIAGGIWISRAGCGRCHAGGGIADPVGSVALHRPRSWITSHIADPEVIGPGVRQPPPVNVREIEAILAYVRRVSADGAPPQISEEERDVALLVARHCVGCHRLDGDGGTEGPDLSRVGARRDVAWLRRWIAEPEDLDPNTSMPSFESRLTPDEIESLARHLAARR